LFKTLTFEAMKHLVLGIVFMFIAILCGFEFGQEVMNAEKNWLKIGFFGVICITATIFYFKERAKRTAFFKKRIDDHNKENK